MNFKDISEKLVSALSKYNSIAIYIVGSPDPDAIASSYSLKLICDSLKIKSDIWAFKKPSLPQNTAFIKDLNIPISFKESNNKATDYDAYAVMDFQSAFIEGVTKKIPCVAHIDHHAPIEENVFVDFKLIIEDAGSVSTIFAMIIKEFENKIEKKLFVKVSTAILYGIQTDTDNYRHANHLDFDALHYISFFSDKDVIDHITGIPLPGHIISLMSSALKNKEIYKDWLFTGVGYIDESVRDSIALIADFLLQRVECEIVVVFALVEAENGKGLRLDASFRCENKTIDLNRIIKQIAPTGGGRKYKGAIQLNMDYFLNCPDREMLWDLLKLTTIEALKKQRDGKHLVELKRFYTGLNKKIKSLLKKQ